MPKNILVPIDFKVASLNTMRVALEENQGQPVNVVLVYPELLTDSITDLLFYSPHKSIQAHTSPSFKEALEIIRNRFSTTLHSVSIRLFHGSTANALKVFIEANRIDEVYVPDGYQLQVSGSSFNIIPMLQNTGVPLRRVSWKVSTSGSEQEQLNHLFN